MSGRNARAGRAGCSHHRRSHAGDNHHPCAIHTDRCNCRRLAQAATAADAIRPAHSQCRRRRTPAAAHHAQPRALAAQPADPAGTMPNLWPCASGAAEDLHTGEQPRRRRGSRACHAAPELGESCTAAVLGLLAGIRKLPGQRRDGEGGEEEGGGARVGGSAPSPVAGASGQGKGKFSAEMFPDIFSTSAK